jgi:hypothetical protein
MIGMGAAKASVHTGTLEPGTDRQLAASLHTRRGAPALGVNSE